MKRRILSLLLALVMVFSLAGTAMAASIEGFTDLDKEAWYYEYVEDVVSEGYFIGFSDTIFSPDTYMTRAQMVVLLGRLGGAKVDGEQVNKVSTVFTDVPSGTWYSAAVKWANENKLVFGVTPTEFWPNENITREDACTLFIRFLDYMAERDEVTFEHLKDLSRVFKFVDEADIRGYAAASVDECMAYGIAQGDTGDQTGHFYPRSFLKRSEGAKLASMLVDILENGKVVPDSGTVVYPSYPPAGDDEPEDTRILEELLEAGEDVTLAADYTLTGQGDYMQVGIYGDDIVVLDLGGNTLTMASDFYGINVFGNLVITNGTIETYRTSQLNVVPDFGDSYGSLTLDGVTVVKKDGFACALTNKGVCTIKRCTFVNESAESDLIVNSIIQDGIEYPGTMTISNTTFEGEFKTNYPVIVARCGAIHFGSNVKIDAVRPAEAAGEDPYYDIIDVKAEGAVFGTVTVNGVVEKY